MQPIKNDLVLKREKTISGLGFFSSRGTKIARLSTAKIQQVMINGDVHPSVFQSAFALFKMSKRFVTKTIKATYPHVSNRWTFCGSVSLCKSAVARSDGKPKRKQRKKDDCQEIYCTQYPPT